MFRLLEKLREKKRQELARGRELRRLRGNQEAARRLLSREMNKKDIDWKRAESSAGINDETLKELMDFREPGSYDGFI